MIAISALIKLAFQLGIVITFQSATVEETVSTYFDELTDRVVNCIPAETDIGSISICPMADKEVLVYVIQK
jgi:hypothetical protein